MEWFRDREGWGSRGKDWRKYSRVSGKKKKRVERRVEKRRRGKKGSSSQKGEVTSKSSNLISSNFLVFSSLRAFRGSLVVDPLLPSPPKGFSTAEIRPQQDRLTLQPFLQSLPRFPSSKAEQLFLPSRHVRHCISPTRGRVSNPVLQKNDQDELTAPLAASPSSPRPSPPSSTPLPGLSSSKTTTNSSFAVRWPFSCSA